MTTKQWNKKSVDQYGQYDNSELRVLHPELLRMLGNVREKDIADYGCGEGKLLLELLEKGARIRGYDISQSMVDESRKRIGDRGELKVIESGAIPLQDNSLDSVVSNLVLMMCPSVEDIRGIFSEVNRVLKPNGPWVYCVTHPAFVDQDFTTYRNIFKGKRNYFEEAQSYQFVLKRKDGTEVTDKSFVDHHYPLSTYLNLLPETGFKFRELKEVQLEGNDLPPYLIVKGDKE